MKITLFFDNPGWCKKLKRSYRAGRYVPSSVEELHALLPFASNREEVEKLLAKKGTGKKRGPKPKEKNPGNGLGLLGDEGSDEESGEGDDQTNGSKPEDEDIESDEDSDHELDEESGEGDDQTNGSKPEDEDIESDEDSDHELDEESGEGTE